MMQLNLSYEFASRHGVLVDDGIVLHRPGLALETIIELRRVFGAAFELKEIGAEQFQSLLTLNYQSRDGAAQLAAEEVGADMNLDALMDDLPRNTDLLSGADDAPVIRLINAILAQAVREKASDVHLEPFEDRVAVRFRIDGVLSEVLSPRPALAPVLVSRIKVMARLDIAEKRLPQDGRITVRLAGQAVDLRVSIIPSAFGERVVLRLLDQAAGHMNLPQLNMPPKVMAGFERALRKPHGIILVTGPTGSGKTTTLYAGLSHINDRSRNILTIEDPVEYLLPGIGQTQVNNKVDMTFSRGLRAILRQDPDVVMVGEIRDVETAAIAVQASLTGHLVLSTLHTNTAIGAIVRLRDMGIEPFLLASSLEVVMAQRLVRLLCEACKEPHLVTQSEQERFALSAGTVIYQATGCELCKQTGYRGRTGIYELIEVDSHLRHLIHDSAAEGDMLAHVRQQADSMEQNGLQRVVQGVTTIEEVLRVTSSA